MFDWNDEELSNIIWGENGGDHIVPFQDEKEDYHCDKNEWNREGTTVNKLSDQRNPEAKGEFYGRKQKDGLSSELSLTTAEKNDQDSRDLYNSSVAELDKGPENFQNALDGKEQGDFVDYSWANIGSFDDLDQILSDDDPIFGHVSLDGADELWPSSKDVTNSNSPVKPFPITEESASFELGELGETSQHLDRPSFFPNYALQGAQNIPGGKSKPTVKEKRDLVTGGKAPALNSSPAAEKARTPYHLSDKAGGLKKPSKNRKKPEQKAEAKLAQHLYTGWNPSGQYENRNASSSVLNQQRQLQRPDALQYHHHHNLPGPFIAYPAYGNFANPYPMTPFIRPGEFRHPTMFSGYEAPPCLNPMNKSVDIPAKTLTPQEKIEKLRKRQQMRAMLAIKKQQKQFGHHIQNVEGSVCAGEDLSSPSFFDQNSPLKQDDSNTVSLASDDCSVEETVLNRVQDVISKLDVGIRVRIRDSLFRLAQSAMQRNNENDEQEVAGQKELDTDNTEMPDTETETNPIDRIVAHLLFQIPTDKYPETPEGSKSDQKKSHRESKSPNVDTSNYELGDRGALENETSQ